MKVKPQPAPPIVGYTMDPGRKMDLQKYLSAAAGVPVHTEIDEDGDIVITFRTSPPKKTKRTRKK